MVSAAHVRRSEAAGRLDPGLPALLPRGQRSGRRWRLPCGSFVFMTGGASPSRFDPLTWHIHAMLFGFVPAAIAGFMLTAIPNWTGRPPIHGAPLARLVALWLLGRIACLISAFMPLWLAAPSISHFPSCSAPSRRVRSSRHETGAISRCRCRSACSASPIC